MTDPYTPPSVPESALPPASPLGLSSEERMWAMIGHLSSLTGLVSGAGFVVGPLIVWQVKKDSMPFAAEEAKEALNFNISWLIWNLILWFMTVVLFFVFFIGLLLVPVAAIFSIAWVALTIIGGLKANEGKPYRYPLTIRFFT